MSTAKEAEYRAICSQITLQEKKEGFFLSLAETISEKIDIDLFAKHTTDYERIKLVAGFCWNSVGAQLIYRGKKPEDGIAKRQLGNKLFEKGDYQKALLYYCQSIIQSPVGQELVNVYSNRSALFQKMGEYDLAITDAELAINYGAPEVTRHKLYERMAACYLATQNYHKAKVILRLAKHFSEKFDKENAKFTQKLEKLSKAINAGMEGNKANNESKKSGENKENENKTFFKPSKRFPSASNKLDVKFSPGFGRFAYALKNISVGEEVLRENPFASCLSPDRMGTHCLHCFKRLKAPIACETCANVAFCSRDCKKQGDVYHRYECRVMTLLMGSGMSLNCYLALRIITQNSLEDFKKVVPQLNINPEVIPTELDDTFASNYLNIYNLGGLEDQRPPVELLQRSIMAIFMVKCLRLVGYFDINVFKNPLPTPDELQICALLLRNLQVIQFNAYEICEFLMENKSAYQKSTTQSLGLAIYPTASYFNHSCVPNVTRYFIGTTMVSTAIGGVPANQAIFDNYGPQLTKEDTNERRLKLSGRYWFHCTCDACVNNWPKLQLMSTDIKSKNPEEANALKMLQKLETLYFDTAMKAMEFGKPEKAIELLRKFIQESETILAQENVEISPYKPVSLAQKALQLCYCSMGSVHFAQEL